MLEAYEITHLHSGDVFLETIVPYDDRKKSRHKAVTTCGKDVGWFLERGLVLAQDDILKCTDGTLVKIHAAEEKVSVVRSEDKLLQMRAAYHLGNRHVPLQVELDELSYQYDYVLDEMVRGLGLLVSTECRPFNPEKGAYGGGHRHSHE